jgi:uncharacterized protein YyaL (SSP411 family)
MNMPALSGSFEKKHNHLINEKSPYLLQHARNPVDWFPWCKDAFDKAKQENKPIFLSIGYATCHWCHVMAHESFEDDEVAGLMNDAFVCIKVDREERPDIDRVYMSVCQLVTGGGGWPLTIIMTPEKSPIFAGTYIPKKGRFGLVGLLELIPRIRDLWKTQAGKLMEYAGQITAALMDIEEMPEGGELDTSILREAYDRLALAFDKEFGGFGGAPKFPSPHNILFLLRFWKRAGLSAALDMVEKSLQAMRQGGIYDHIGFGFHRYSTDQKWLIPHFEKMLYDQALLAMAYTEAYQAAKKNIYARTAHEILTYVLRDLASPEGGFYSAEDADSEGEEGRYYLWTKEEVLRLLEKGDADLISRVFNLSAKGNYPRGETPGRPGKNILYMDQSLSEIASGLGISLNDLVERLEHAREKLFDSREKRIHPFKDDKILTDWNGLMIAALAKGGRVFEKPKYTEAAMRAADFIMTRMSMPDDRLLHRYREGEPGINGCLDDYAFFIWGLLELFETTFDASYLKSALRLHHVLKEHFWDASGGGFYFTPDDSEALLVRQKGLYDGAMPSGNSVCMLNLLRLFHITSDPRFAEDAAVMGRVFSAKVKASPNTYTQFMVALDYGFGPSHQVVIVGGSQTEDSGEMLRAIRNHFIPNKTVIFYPAAGDASAIEEISPFVKGYRSIGGKTTVYVCQDHLCKKPTTEADKMLEMLGVFSE